MTVESAGRTPPGRCPMMPRRFAALVCFVLSVLVAATGASGQQITVKPTDRWITVTGVAAGLNETAKDEAVAQALRTAVEQACGVFLTAQSQSRDYQAVYDKIFADAVGYVREYKVLKTWTDDEKTHASVRARVSTQKFEKDWSVIAHTVERENNPRLIVVILEAVYHATLHPGYEVKETGIVQGKIEDFFISRGITLMDHAVAGDISKRDVLLAVVKDDTEEVAALGARFKADVVLIGRASAKYGKTIEIAGQTMYQYTATLNIRVIQADSARLLVSKSYGPVTSNTLQRAGSGDKALAKLAEDAAPKILTAIVDAWRARAYVSRTVQLSISGMDYETWKAFKAEAKELRGVQALRLREITESVANIDAEYRYTNETLADHLTEMKAIKLTITEITPNRIKLKLVE